MFLKEFFEKVNFEKKSSDDNKSMKITQHAKSWDTFVKVLMHMIATSGWLLA